LLPLAVSPLRRLTPGRVRHHPDGVRPCLTQSSGHEVTSAISDPAQGHRCLYSRHARRDDRTRKTASRARLYRGKWMGGVAYGLRRLSKDAQEASAHPLTVAKACFLGDFLDRQPYAMAFGELQERIPDVSPARKRAVVQRDDNKPRASPASGQPKSTRPAVLCDNGRRSGDDAPGWRQDRREAPREWRTQLLPDEAGGAAAACYSQIR
jgi:hypothetical protein